MADTAHAERIATLTELSRQMRVDAAHQNWDAAQSKWVHLKDFVYDRCEGDDAAQAVMLAARAGLLCRVILTQVALLRRARVLLLDALRQLVDVLQLAVDDAATQYRLHHDPAADRLGLRLQLVEASPALTRAP
jgi:hypothetical protein